MVNETPREAAKRLLQAWIEKGYVPKALHTYRTAEGEAIFEKARLEHPEGDAAPDGRKIIRPLHLNGNGYKLGEPKFDAGNKPLYALERIAANPDAPVWIVE